MQTMDNLLMNKHVNFAQYLERLPSGVIPMKDKLLQEIAGNDIDGQVIVRLLADYVEGLPPEMQEQIRAMPPEEMEEQVKQMVLQQEPQAQQMPQEPQEPQEPQIDPVAEGIAQIGQAIQKIDSDVQSSKQAIEQQSKVITEQGQKIDEMSKELSVDTRLRSAGL
jgi:hypothetical protein